MAEFNESESRVTFKLVYYGPALSGKTTNLTQLHGLIRPELLGNLMTLETRNDRTLFFDLLPMGFRTSSGLLIKLKLFTVPGQVAHDSTRKAVLSRADGVVFVADSQKNQATNNGESFDNLAQNAARVGLDFDNIPLVVQFNKRDLPAIQSEQEISERWSSTPWPIVFATALVGNGVLQTFRKLLEHVYEAAEAEHALQRTHGLSRAAFVAALLGA